MAIGDTPNQNLFGTNYNAEEEERKKAELAAQNARMGSGTLPDLDSNIVAQVPGIENIRNPSAFDPETGYLGNIKPGEPIMSTGTVERVTPNSLVVNKISDVVQGLRDTVGTESVSMEDYQARQATQAPSEASALQATQGVTPPVETPSAGAQGQGMDMNQSAIMNALTDQNQGMDMNQQAIANAQGQEATAPPPAQTLSQFMRYEDAPEQRTEQFLDEQGRLRFRPTQEALQLQAQGAVTQPPVDSAVPPAVAQPPVDALSSFEKDSLARQQRIGGTGSFEGDSEAREARLRENERQPGESQSAADTRAAQSRTTGGQTEGLSFDDARRRAEGQLAERGVKNPRPSQVNALARSIQAGEPERLAELKTQKAINEAKLKTAQATLDRPEFEGKVYTVNGVTFAQTSRGGAQVIDTGTETAQESTAKMKDFVFALEQIDKAREAFAAGDLNKANDIFTAAGIQKNGFDVTASEYFGGSAPQVTPANPTVSVTGGGLTQQQEAGIQRVMADNKITREEAIKALKESGQLK